MNDLRNVEEKIYLPKTWVTCLFMKWDNDAIFWIFESIKTLSYSILRPDHGKFSVLAYKIELKVNHKMFNRVGTN